MPGFVTCPSCREELDIPPQLFGQPVRCAACGNMFTPTDESPPTAPRAKAVSRDDNRDDDRFEESRFDDRRDDSRDDAATQRRRRSFERPPPRRRSNLWVWLVLFGTFGICTLGCGGFLVFAVSFADPDLTDYKSPDGRFETAFPGPVTVARQPVPNAGGVLGVTTIYDHRRTILGETLDVYFVRAIELREKSTKRERDQALQTVANELVAGGQQVRRGPALLGNAEGIELQVNSNDAARAETLLARLAIINDQLYVVGVRGQSLKEPREQIRVVEFWSRFSALEEAEPPIPNLPIPDDE